MMVTVICLTVRILWHVTMIQQPWLTMVHAFITMRAESAVEAA
jgi:hypothetical protein